MWGDLNPSTKEMEGQYGKKYKGSVTEEDSLITKGNGFSKIHDLKPGESPDCYIDILDKECEEKLKKQNNG